MAIEQLAKGNPEQTGQFTNSFAERVNHLTADIKHTAKSILEWAVSKPFIRRRMRKLMPFVAATATDSTEFDFSELDKFNEPIDPKRTSIIAVASHFSHADGRISIHIAEMLRTKFGFIEKTMLPVSQTLLDGRQGVIGQIVYTEMGEPDLIRNGITPLYVYTENDEIKRNATATSAERRVIMKSIENDSTDPKTGIVLLAGGTVEPGRYNKDGVINGLQEVTDPFLKAVLKYTREADMEMLVVPVGISRTYRLLSATTLWVTRESFLNLIKRMLGLNVDKLATVRYGRPFFVGADIDRDDINRFIMEEKVAPLVWEQDQGVYGNRK